MSYAPIRSEIARNHQEYTDFQTTVLSSKPRKPLTRLRRKRSLSARSTKHGVAPDYPIIVHSHLCWDWVWQRPQQFVSRLSRRHKVLFVETVAPDPELVTAMARFRKPPEFPNLTVLRLQFPAWRWSDGEFVDSERRRLVREFLAGPVAGEFEDPVQWFYDPMAVTAFAGHMEEVLTVYDCMDELSKFRFAPPEMLRRELELLARAEVVFTGGRKLFENKSRFHDNCHFYGCGVDDAHFGQARAPETAVHAALAGVPKPILGYFGVIDERMDYDLIAALADANPKWSVVMVGPVTKVDPKLLPQRTNLHWLGQRTYEELPALCKGFDVCLMPFALNEATEFINPTKALEYMATTRPIVSTPVTDVVRNFGAVVKIARSAAEFVACCQQALEQPDREAIQRGLDMVGENSWESIIARLEEHIQEALLAKRSTGMTA